MAVGVGILLVGGGRGIRGVFRGGGLRHHAGGEVSGARLSEEHVRIYLAYYKR